MTDSWNDEKISSVVAENGLEIYGFWWRVLEIIAKQMDESDRTYCVYSDKSWSNFCGITVKKFQKFQKILKEKKLIFVEIVEKDTLINVPNLLKYRDEYSAKKKRLSGVCPE